MDIKQLQYFIKVAETENMTKAARYFDVSQSAITQSIKNLENELGVDLFERLNKRISISSAGEVFLTHANKIIKEYGLAVDEMRSFGTEADVVTVATMSGAMVSTLKTRIEPLIYPTEIQCFRVSEKDSIAQLKNRQVDMAISSKRINDVDIVNTPFYKETLFMILSKDDPLAKQKVIELSDLRDRRVVICRSDGIIGAASQSFIFEVMKEEINTDLYMISSIDEFRKNMNTGTDLYLVTKSDRTQLSATPDRTVIPVSSDSIAVEYYINYRYEYEKRLLPLIRSMREFYKNNR